jgi:hypothetical protein
MEVTSLGCIVNFCCHNFKIAFAIKVWNAKAHEPKRVCLGVKHTITNGEECKGWSPMTPKCIPSLGVTFVRESSMFKTFGWKGKKTSNWAPIIPLEGIEV